MKPAASLIAFTVLSGAGLGLVFWIGLGFGPSEGVGASAGALIALILTGAGGASSVFHLARPDRAWRAFSQFRSSWLSREACLVAITVGLFLPYTAAWALGWGRFWAVGYTVSALAAATVYCTAMIYAQLATVPRWSATPTPVLFLAFSALGGLATLETVDAFFGSGVDGLALAALALLTGGIWIWWQTAAAGAGRCSTGATLASATGLGRMGRVRAFEPPHTGENYLLEEMAFVVGRRRAFGLRRAGAVLGFLVPAALAVLAPLIADGLVLLALLSHFAGAAALRWLFFAEAEHVQAHYYGGDAVRRPA